MVETVVILGALDTKGDELAFIKELIEATGLDTLVVDFGVMGPKSLQPDIPCEQVAAAGEGDLARLRTGKHKDEAMQVMSRGVERVIHQLWEQGQVAGVISMGGSGGTSIATAGMRALPVGVPKVMVSTLGGGDVSAYAGAKDITFMPSVVDVSGINRISRTIYTNAAGAIAGMVKTKSSPPGDEKPLITASMFGNTTKCVDHARGLLEKRGYEVLVFHATGSGGRTMESLIQDGYVTASLDITTTELADEACGGVLSAGPDRGLAASRAGIPAVLVPGCVDMANFWGLETVPAQYQTRKLYQWNPNVTLLRTNAEENARIGAMIATAANAATAPVCVLLPLKGVSQLDSPGGDFWDPEADQACYDAIKGHLEPGIPVIESDHNINDPEFAEKAVALLLEMLA